MRWCIYSYIYIYATRSGEESRATNGTNIKCGSCWWRALGLNMRYPLYEGWMWKGAGNLPRVIFVCSLIFFIFTWQDLLWHIYKLYIIKYWSCGHDQSIEIIEHFAPRISRNGQGFAGRETSKLRWQSMMCGIPRAQCVSIERSDKDKYIHFIWTPHTHTCSLQHHSYIWSDSCEEGRHTSSSLDISIFCDHQTKTKRYTTHTYIVFQVALIQLYRTIHIYATYIDKHKTPHTTWCATLMRRRRRRTKFKVCDSHKKEELGRWMGCGTEEMDRIVEHTHINTRVCVLETHIYSSPIYSIYLLRGHRLVSQLLHCLKWQHERQMDTADTSLYFKTEFRKWNVGRPWWP